MSKTENDRIGTGSRKLAPVPANYLPLHKYLDGRYADLVTLTFAEIEDLLGHALPAAARSQPEWWAAVDTAPPSPQSLAWLQAHRTASANLPARKVLFERKIA